MNLSFSEGEIRAKLSFSKGELMRELLAQQLTDAATANSTPIRAELPTPLRWMSAAEWLLTGA